MSERDDLLASIAQTISDYRYGKIAVPTQAHVDRWIGQFDEAVQLPMLREMNHVLQKSYFSLENVTTFLKGLIKTEALAGSDFCTFWRGVQFLDIQGGGNSQTEMLALFRGLLKKECGLDTTQCGTDSSGVYMYLDDAIFSGARMSKDLIAWINDGAPPKVAELHVIVIATHEGSYYYKGKVRDAINAAKKEIAIKWWHAMALEDRKAYVNSSDVMRPARIPADANVQAYVSTLGHEPILRTAGQVGALGLFSSDQGRQLLEEEFLKAGVRIRRSSPDLNQYQRPLGNMVLKTLGFGSTIVTFRNCPNNAPLALWAGDPWYPLFPRTTNSQTAIRRSFMGPPGGIG